jgi:hypothetical protein
MTRHFRSPLPISSRRSLLYAEENVTLAAGQCVVNFDELALLAVGPSGSHLPGPYPMTEIDGFLKSA